jgi:hypothetical protein
MSTPSSHLPGSAPPSMGTLTTPDSPSGMTAPSSSPPLSTPLLPIDTRISYKMLATPELNYSALEPMLKSLSHAPRNVVKRAIAAITRSGGSLQINIPKGKEVLATTLYSAIKAAFMEKIEEWSRGTEKWPVGLVVDFSFEIQGAPVSLTASSSGSVMIDEEFAIRLKSIIAPDDKLDAEDHAVLKLVDFYAGPHLDAAEFVVGSYLPPHGCRLEENSSRYLLELEGQQDLLDILIAIRDKRPLTVVLIDDNFFNSKDKDPYEKFQIVGFLEKTLGCSFKSEGRIEPGKLSWQAYTHSENNVRIVYVGGPAVKPAALRALERSHNIRSHDEVHKSALWTSALLKTEDQRSKLRSMVSGDRLESHRRDFLNVSRGGGAEIKLRAEDGTSPPSVTPHKLGGPSTSSSGGESSGAPQDFATKLTQSRSPGTVGPIAFDTSSSASFLPLSGGPPPRGRLQSLAPLQVILSQEEFLDVCRKFSIEVDQKLLAEKIAEKIKATEIRNSDEVGVTRGYTITFKNEDDLSAFRKELSRSSSSIHRPF